MKKILSFFVLALSISLSFSTSFAKAQSDHEPASCDKKHIEVFVREGCGFCAQEEAFLEELKGKSICHIVFLDVAENADLYNNITKKFNLSRVTPISLVGNEIIVGFSEANAKKIIYNLENSETFYTFENLLDASFPPNDGISNPNAVRVSQVETVKMPFIGEMSVEELRKKSLTTMSVVLGFIDGFNPCAMWVLVVFLLALLQMNDRFKMFVMAGIFMLAEAIMYAFILGVWLTTWNFVGFDRIITPIVAVVALGAGGFFLYEGIFSDGTCKVTSAEQRKKISEKIHNLAHSPMGWGFVLGILVLAFSVNIIEFACSIGIPQTFTKILDMQSDMSIFGKIWYIIIYIFFYMIDDLLVFGLAIWSIEKIGITHKYAKASNVIGGILMLLLGGLLLFAPQFLALG